MKKQLHVLTMIICSTIGVKAQITITQSDVLQNVGSVLIMANDSLVIGKEGSSGASQTWDLSSLRNTKSDSIAIIDPTSNPYFGSFSNANIAMINSDALQFVNLNANAAELLGGVVQFLSGVYTEFHNNPSRKLIQFPASFTNSWNSQARSVMSFPNAQPPIDSIMVINWNFISDTVDGWGNVTTPAGTFACIRIRTIVLSNDSMFMHNSVTGAWQLANAPAPSYDTSYAWWAKGKNIMLATIKPGDQSGMYLASSFTGLKTLNANREIMVYPNPAKSYFHVQSDKAIKSLTLTNILGETIQLENPLTSDNYVSLNGVKSGVYILKVYTSEGFTQQKICVE